MGREHTTKQSNPEPYVQAPGCFLHFTVSTPGPGDCSSDSYLSLLQGTPQFARCSHIHLTDEETKTQRG